MTWIEKTKNTTSWEENAANKTTVEKNWADLDEATWADLDEATWADLVTTIITYNYWIEKTKNTSNWTEETKL